MGRIDIILSDDLEKKFRKKVFDRYGMKKGNISLAIENAIQGWINNGGNINKNLKLKRNEREDINEKIR